MKIPLEITWRNLDKDESLDRLIREKAGKLEQVCDYLSSCRVAIERAQHEHAGLPYRVRIDLTVPPGHELAVTRAPGKADKHEPLPTVIRNTFAAARRQLKKLVERQRGEVKSHPEQEVMGVVIRLFRDDGYGFIKSTDGQEIYFHRNSVLNGGYDRLEIGTGVRFVSTMGEKGPQATTVQIVDKPGARISDEGESPIDVPAGWR